MLICVCTDWSWDVLVIRCSDGCKVHDCRRSRGFPGAEFAISDVWRPIRPQEVEGYDLQEACRLIKLAARNIDILPSTFSSGDLPEFHEPAVATRGNVDTGDAAGPADGDLSEGGSRERSNPGAVSYTHLTLPTTPYV